MARCLQAPPLAGPSLHDKAPIWLETADGVLHEVEWEAAMLFPLVQREVLLNGCGPRDKVIIALPSQVNPGTLKLLLDYCRFHKVSGRSDKERKVFDEKFVRLDTKTLCELTSAADSLDMKPLVDLTSRALARIIEGKSPKEIRETFGLPDDLTEEEKLEPVKNTTADLRLRLLNRLYAKKRKELQQKKLLMKQDIVSEEIRPDERSVDDLLSFIGGDNKTGAKPAKTKKKKNKRRKDLSKGNSHASENEPSQPKAEHSGRSEGEMKTLNSPAESIMEGEEYPEEEDDFDPVMKEKLDREVEDFARRLRLNGDWLTLAPSNQDHRFWPDRPMEKYCKSRSIKN